MWYVLVIGYITSEEYYRGLVGGYIYFEVHSLVVFSTIVIL